ncbi:hypothetical protein [Hydrogenophaga sp.]|uniref:VOC family protein n=1 Tax=Hydrogenophaga sp. TaxID=1904254 RepID=UPI0025C260E1|nr:hypothetical protein [Hydrogenophaga sp.]MBT9462829.1 hypothetical protein [Hydrogenophaga sp.]
MSASPNALNWFEIPVTDFSRAKAFYEAVLGRPIEQMAMGPTTMGFLSSDPAGVGEIGNNYGFFAHFLDTEGNKIGLHSMA